jgi:hypothetical protein
MTSKRDDQLLWESIKIQDKPAKEAGELAFLARILIMSTMPHSKPRERVGP